MTPSALALSRRLAAVPGVCSDGMRLIIWESDGSRDRYESRPVRVLWRCPDGWLMVVNTADAPSANFDDVILSLVPVPWIPGGGPTPAIDLDDPATRGCLLAVLRERTGAPAAQATPWTRPGPDGKLVASRWRVVLNRTLNDGDEWESPTEGEALAAALLATVGT